MRLTAERMSSSFIAPERKTLMVLPRQSRSSVSPRYSSMISIPSDIFSKSTEVRRSPAM
jgi:hypothetical protein